MRAFFVLAIAATRAAMRQSFASLGFLLPLLSFRIKSHSAKKLEKGLKMSENKLARYLLNSLEI